MDPVQQTWGEVNNHCHSQGNSFLLVGSGDAAAAREVGQKGDRALKRDEEAGTPPQRCSGEQREGEHGGRTESCSGPEEEGILCNLEGGKKQK